MKSTFSNRIFRPEASEYPASYSAYIGLVSQEELLSGLAETKEKTSLWLQTIPEEKHLFRYQPEKWTIQELVQHVIDAERIFAYRALRYARKDKTVLSSFDENEFVENSRANLRNWSDLLAEYEAVRHATIQLFNGFSEEALTVKGQTDLNQMSVRALGFAILGHEIHHWNVVRERYL